jgi:Tfp pilus assembly protein PilN
MIYLKTSVGIELRGEDMLISSLQGNFSGGVFTHFKRVVNYPLRDKAEVQQEILHFFKSTGLGKDNIILGIPRRDLVLRYLDLPAEVADNLKQVVQYQVQSFEPTEEDKFYYDYALFNGSGAPKRLSILLAMVRKAYLDNHLQLLREIGIRPVAVIGSSMGLTNIFLGNRKEEKNKIYVLADLSASALEVVALNHGTIVYSREVAKENSSNWMDLILREINEATSKIRLSPEDELEQIVLAGESSESAHEEIKDAIPDCILLKSAIPDAVPGANKIHLQEAASTLGLACTGLLRQPAVRLNLLPADLRRRQTRWAYVPAVLLGMAILALLSALGLHGMVQDRKLARQLDREIQALKAPVDRVQSLRNGAETLEKRTQSVEGLLRNRDMNLDILKELTATLPPDTYLNSYSNRDGIIQIGGLSGSAYDLMPKLEKSPLLKDVVQRGSINKEVQSGKDRFSFEMKLER